MPKRNTKSKRSHQFIDLEADVADDVSEEETQESGHGREEEEFFVDDIEVDDIDDEDAAPLLYTHKQLSDQEDGHEKFFTDLLERATTRSSSARTFGGLQQLEETILTLPQEGDWPLWRVKTRVGLEEISVASLITTAHARHEIRSAFSRGSIRGSIYVEATMNEPLQRLLRNTPGIMLRQVGIQAQMVDASDHQALLKMPTRPDAVSPGQWIVVTRGIYRGDPGLVLKAGSWGCRVLLVPRLSDGETRKRKTTREIPEPHILPSNWDEKALNATRKVDDIYIAGSFYVSHRLLEKPFDLHSVSKDIRDMPYKHYWDFRASNHPSLVRSYMPRPREWKFKSGERVMIVSEGYPGVVGDVEVYVVEVLRDTRGLEIMEGEYSSMIPWQDVRKIVSVGDYVTVVGGAHVGQSGWITGVDDDDTITVCTFHSSEKIETWLVFVNLVEIVQPPHHLQAFPVGQGPSGDLPRQDTRRHPWCGVEVIIMTGAQKQARAVVLDVFGNPSEEMEGHKIGLDLQLRDYNPATPFHRQRFAYSEVLEASTYQELMRFKDPGSAFIRTAPPTGEPKYKNRLPATTTSPPVPASTSGAGQTPMWDNEEYLADSSLLPAFNPTAPDPTHPLLNPLLVGLEVMADVKGGEWPDGHKMPVWTELSTMGFGLHLRGRRTRSETTKLEPEWVTVKVPSAKLDNSLLVIIKGEHCAKFARRIRHVDDHTGPYGLVVAEVVRTLSGGDRVTGAQYTLSLDHFAMIHKETAAEKKGKDGLMKALRAPYKTR